MGRQTAATTSFPPAEMDGALAGIESEIAAQQTTIREIEEALREHKGKLRRLEDARKVLLRTSRIRSGEKREKTDLERAGRGNIVKIRELLAHNGPTAKSEITKLMGINDGTVTYALRHLEKEHDVRATGEVVRGSKVYEYVTRRAVTRPGDTR